MALADVATVLAEEAGEVAAQAAELQQRLLRLSERLEEEQDGRLPEHLAALGYETILWRADRCSVPDNARGRGGLCHMAGGVAGWSRVAYTVTGAHH